jgi:hypothetical protein
MADSNCARRAVESGGRPGYTVDLNAASKFETVLRLVNLSYAAGSESSTWTWVSE